MPLEFMCPARADMASDFLCSSWPLQLLAKQEEQLPIGPSEPTFAIKLHNELIHLTFSKLYVLIPG